MSYAKCVLSCHRPVCSVTIILMDLVHKTEIIISMMQFLTRLRHVIVGISLRIFMQHAKLFNSQCKKPIILFILLISNIFVCELGSSVSIVSGCGLDHRAIVVPSQAEAKGFFLLPLCPDRL
jgi:hypothetical protein